MLSVHGQFSIQLLVDSRATPTCQLPRDDDGLSGPQNLPASLKGVPCPGPDGQHNGGSLYQSPRCPQVASPVQDDSTSPVLGTKQTPLFIGGLCSGQTEPGSRYVVQGQCSSRAMETTSQDGSDNLVSFPQGRGRPLCLRRQLSLTNQFLKTAGFSGL